jgi:CheY-like chemotaxis protein
MPRGGRLTVAVRNVYPEGERTAPRFGARTGPQVLLAVSDTGNGIAPEVLPHIWEPFYTTKAEGKGTGLGLAVVQNVVQETGGHVRVHSQVGCDTTFEVYFPRVADQPVPSKSSPLLVSLPRGLETILLVEDEDAVRSLSRQILQGCGYTILEARDGEEALRVAQKHAGDPIDLLVTDVVLPRLDGRELAESLLRQRPLLKVLYFSGHGEDAVLEHGVIPHQGGFLQKPFTASALAQKVRDDLDANQSQRNPCSGAGNEPSRTSRQ